MRNGEERVFFGPFALHPAERRLKREGEALPLTGRYFDVLVLLVRERGSLVTKERLHQDVWRGVPVTDEAITQAIRTLRRELGDAAANPTYIETVPRHGYRFIAPVESEASAEPAAATGDARTDVMRTGLAGVAGGALAGLIGGVFYGFGAYSDGQAGGVSILLVLACITVLVATIGAIGVSFGIAAARFATRRQALWMVAGGALGGLLEGGLVKLLGVDTLHLLFGHAPRGLTGGPEGLVLGGAVGLGVALSRRAGGSLVRRVSVATLAGAAGGALVAAAGGRLMGGSLALLAQSLPDSRLSFDSLGILAGQDHFGGAAQMVAAGLEGALFAGCIALGMEWGIRTKKASEHPPRPGGLRGIVSPPGQ